MEEEPPPAPAIVYFSHNPCHRLREAITAILKCLGLDYSSTSSEESDGENEEMTETRSQQGTTHASSSNSSSSSTTQQQRDHTTTTLVRASSLSLSRAFGRVLVIIIFFF